VRGHLDAEKEKVVPDLAPSLLDSWQFVRVGQNALQSAANVYEEHKRTEEEALVAKVMDSARS